MRSHGCSKRHSVQNNYLKGPEQEKSENRGTFNSTRARSYSGTRISHDGSETLTLGETAIKETEGKGRRGGSRERRFSRYARSYLMYLYRSGYI
ncbi:hypothetical protein NC653_026161 [Populus alba x Populus x berolinensis]|uniref:Uncharacterized protein n=1 Tax=Populus alba x Populus x berolinensis TaxID=444605 RepID=A0AAD6MCY8_9ROSI|nr:hypothetical protein NC653_026161 [Populus alba x Populus x berolinensis]